MAVVDYSRIWLEGLKKTAENVSQDGSLRVDI
jgi:hypothetical protein